MRRSPGASVRAGLRARVRRAATPAFHLLQSSGAAAIAWVLANRIGNHDDPFFAPIAAMVALSQPLEDRGASPIRLLSGVVIGIVAGELAVGLVPVGGFRMLVAAFAAMALATALRAPRLVIVQSGTSAVLTVAVADGEYGLHRLADAAIGAGVALVFSQVLFSPEPVRLMRRAEQAVLARMAAALRDTADALDSDQLRLGTAALDSLRGLIDDLGALSRMRNAGHRMRRRSPLWWTRAAPVEREHENAGQLDLLAGSCVMLTRSAYAVPPAERHVLAPSVRAIADALTDLAADPGSAEVRQQAVDRALDVARAVAGEARRDPSLLAALVSLQQVAADLMVFGGVDPGAAKAAVDEGTGEFRAITPPATARLPFAARRRPPSGRRERRPPP